MKLGWKWWGHWEQSGGIQSYVLVDIKLFFKDLKMCFFINYIKFFKRLLSFSIIINKYYHRHQGVTIVSAPGRNC